MNTAQSVEISVAYLSWINLELRKEAEQKEELLTRRAQFMARMKTLAVAGLSGISLLVVKMLDY